MKKTGFAAMIVLTLVGAMAFGQSTDAPQDSSQNFSLGITPNVSVPLGTSATVFTLGGGGDLTAVYRMPFLPLLYAGGSAGYSFVPIKTFTTLSLVNAGVSAGLQIDILPSLSLRAFGTGGYFFAFLNNGAGPKQGNPYFAGGAELALALDPAWRIGAGATYRTFYGLYNDLSVYLGTSYNLLAPKSTGRPVFIKGIEIEDLSFDDVFPVLHTWYENHSFGKLRIKNAAAIPLTNLVVSLNVKQYMDAATEFARIPTMKPGEERVIDIKALFSEGLFGVVQMTKAAAEVSVSYTVQGVTDSRSQTKTLTVWDRNSMTWDTTAKAAAFVMPKEPTVLTFSSNVNAAIKDIVNRVVDKNLQRAIAVHDALRLIGISYVSPPLTSYAVRSLDKSVVDSLKFPRQTFEGRSGDCSDLSILYTSILESLQIETAFITVPGHIFMAFAMSSSPDEARKLASADNLIIKDGKVWVPVEVTERKETFLTAWEVGAKEWKEASAAGQADLVPVHDAWKTFVPANFIDSGVSTAAITLAEPAKIVKDFSADMDAFIGREIFAQESLLTAAVTKSKSDPKAVNSLGLLYARYDQTDKAETQFLKAISKVDYGPALVNLGNLYFLKGDMQRALAYYNRAFRLTPHDPTVLLCVARVNHELQNYDAVKKAYDELKTLKPDLAAQFDYLELKVGDSGLRAAAVTEAREVQVWSE